MTSFNIILIGMPGSGKSTVGPLLAAQTSRGFVDTDVLIRSETGRSLQDIVDKEGYLALRAIEEKVLLGLQCRGHVVATGGSAVYSPPAMAHLRSKGIVVFLRTDMKTLRRRVTDFETRGLAKRRDQGVEDLFDERSALYRTYADATIDCDELSPQAVVERIIDALRHRL